MATTNNSTLTRARLNPADEYYTRLKDIAREVAAYPPQVWAGKHVYLNTDHPASAFWRFFSANFAALKLSGLTCTWIGSKWGLHKNGQTTESFRLTGGGGWQSEECLAIAKTADIVCTNPPFSQYATWLPAMIECGVDVLAIGPISAASCKNIWPLVLNGKLRLGAGFQANNNMTFVDPFGVEHQIGARWYTTLPVNKPAIGVAPLTEWDISDYATHDFYEAIEVPKTALIPAGYRGAMAVPLTYLPKHDPSRYRILDANDIRKPGVEIRPTALIKGRFSQVSGKPTYVRIPIQAIEPFAVDEQQPQSAERETAYLQSIPGMVESIISAKDEIPSERLEC
ncbi:adenine-specific methyltransferase EcoRI family protein [Propionimicrobium lymphophilum]|uniref:adenine-specific methyltransferase EcoRI family protein n=1 Tax=Propionimicrobium lymphophilum TaxID=33012 RepID=UPI00254A227E|nr:adenine-specific methyltransferase EcoRI family protein [Propionimicrobium lymphophilum]MDK7710231.1 adenine-specific methyltransferase EcoRI family protein [Propionimicrobium lymphophilum]MDK7734246.1 adenine-specific methyltransferase EcoRI family protein [Propionimicrobium lymphophilum]